jgi:hypothetical protein
LEQGRGEGRAKGERVRERGVVEEATLSITVNIKRNLREKGGGGRRRGRRGCSRDEEREWRDDVRLSGVEIAT